MNMNYMDFVNGMIKRIIDMTGYGEDDVYYTGDREPSVNDTLCICLPEREGCHETIRVHMSRLFVSYYIGKYLDDLAEEMITGILSHLMSPVRKQIASLDDYSIARKMLFIRLLNIHRDGVEENAIYRLVPGGDVAQVVYLYLGDFGDSSEGSVMVTHTLAQRWNKELDEDEIYDEAVRNGQSLFQPKIYFLDNILISGDYFGEDIDMITPESIKDKYGICLSTSNRTNGASAFFMPGVAQKLSYLFGCGIYGVPTSIHEVMVHPDNDIDPESLKSIMSETINEATAESEILTRDYLFHYDPVARTFSCI